MAEKITTTCGCMGVRSCLLCENKSPKNHTINKLYENEPAENILCYDFCIICTATVHKGAKCEHISRTPTPSPGSESFPVLNGIRIVENFVNEEEERQIVSEIDKSEWKMSQSGRRKQVFSNSCHCNQPLFKSISNNSKTWQSGKQSSPFSAFL